MDDDRAVVNVVYGTTQSQRADNAKTARSYHPQSRETMLVLTGQFSAVVEGQALLVANEGDVIYIPKMTYHNVRYSGTGPLVPDGHERLREQRPRGARGAGEVAPSTASAIFSPLNPRLEFSKRRLAVRDVAQSGKANGAEVRPAQAKNISPVPRSPRHEPDCHLFTAAGRILCAGADGTRHLLLPRPDSGHRHFERPPTTGGSGRAPVPLRGRRSSSASQPACAGVAAVHRLGARDARLTAVPLGYWPGQSRKRRGTSTRSRHDFSECSAPGNFSVIQSRPSV